MLALFFSSGADRRRRLKKSQDHRCWEDEERVGVDNDCEEREIDLVSQCRKESRSLDQGCYGQRVIMSRYMSTHHRHMNCVLCVHTRYFYYYDIIFICAVLRLSLHNNFICTWSQNSYKNHLFFSKHVKCETDHGKNFKHKPAYSLFTRNKLKNKDFFLFTLDLWMNDDEMRWSLRKGVD